MPYPLIVAVLFSTLTAVSFSASRNEELRRVDQALREAVLIGTASEVDDAISAGGDARMADRYGTTLLMHAAARGKTKVARLLLKFGASPDARNEEDETALFFAARGCSKPIVDLLLERRVEVNQRNQIGETALMIAAENGCVPVVRGLLAEKNIDLMAADEWGRTALHFIDAAWVMGVGMENADLVREFVLKKAGRPVAKPVPPAIPLGPTVLPANLH